MNARLGSPTEGERWTQAELHRLRDARWSPRAAAAFLRAAQTRSNLTRRRRPDLARQEARWMFVGAAAWVIAAWAIPDDRLARARGRGLLWWGGCALMVDWHLGMLETPDGRPVGLGVPDALTLTRAWLVPAVARCPRPSLLLIGAATDFADGAMARRTRTTRFGRDLEGLVDACFAAAALRAAARTGALSPAPVVLEQTRLLAGVAYSTWVYFASGHAPEPTVHSRGRASAPVRMASLVAAGLGHRQLGDRLLVTGSALAMTALLPNAAPARAGE
ncbi:MAG: CDP-alcohol phosphatidyltransferase family protein [Actinomycetota bacterium]|nr:CDP-alcohol phosphatidyltransferase family protein [Actinomycetota bacterium]